MSHLGRAIALSVMAGEDPADFRTKGAATKAQPGPYTKYLQADSLKGKRFGVPAFIMSAAAPQAFSPSAAPNTPNFGARSLALRPETRALFMKALDELRAAGAAVVIEEDLLPESFARLAQAVNTRGYRKEGMNRFLRDFGPPQYRSAEEYEKTTGSPLPGTVIGGAGGQKGAAPLAQRELESDPDAETNFWAPQRAALAAYNGALDKYRLDGFVYPALQMPPNDETIPQPDGRPSSGPHSSTGWVNKIGVPAVVAPCGFYANGLPFGIEFSARQWADGSLLGWAFAYEQATNHRQPPVLVDRPQPPEDK